MVVTTYPGIYVVEKPSGVSTVAGVSTSTALFIGMTGRGQIDTPTTVRDFSGYVRNFGDDAAVSEMTDQVYQFFSNRGREAVIMRIALNSAPADATIHNEFGQEVLRFEAKEDGRIGNSIRLRIDYDTPEPEATFNLRVGRQETNPSGDPVFVEEELHEQLSMDSSSGRYVVRRLDQDSRLIRAVDVSAATPVNRFAGYSIAGLVMDAADAQVAADVDALIGAPGDTARFEISVDREAFRAVAIAHGVNPANPAGTFQAAVDQTVGGGRVAVTLTAINTAAPVERRLTFASTNAQGGSVRLQGVSGDSFASALQLGTENRGLEVDGHAARRPAATGFYSTLGPRLDLGLVTTLRNVQRFLEKAPADLTDIDLADEIGTENVVTPLPAGAAMWDPVAGSPTSTADPSFGNARERMDSLVAAINNTATRWTAHRIGYRIALSATQNLLDSNPDAGAQLAVTGNGPAGTFYNIGAAGAPHHGLMAANANVRRYQLGYTAGVPAGANVTAAPPPQAGDDGQIPTSAEYDAAYAIIRRDVDIVNILMLPRCTAPPGQTDDDRALLWGPASAFCQEERAFLLIDPREDWNDVDDVTNNQTGVVSFRTGLVRDHAALFWPRVRVVDRDNPRLLKPIDPSGSIAGTMARIDGSRGVWVAAAGTQAGLIAVRGVEHNMSDPDNGAINPQAVNAVRAFSEGVLSWGARTMDGFDNSGNDDYRYIPIRRLALFIEESLVRGLRWALFQPNAEPLWAQLRLAAGTFMHRLFRQGAFASQTASEAYRVKVDSETTTPDDQRRGIVNVIIMFAPSRPAEFIVLTIQQMAQPVDV